MAEINLRNKVKIEVKDDGKVIKSFDVTFREMTRKEKRKADKKTKAVEELYIELEKLTRRAAALENKIVAVNLELNGDYATGAKAQAAFSEIQPVAPVNQKAAALLKPER